VASGGVDEAGIGSRCGECCRPDCTNDAAGVHFWQMRQTITVRLSKELAAWLESTANRSGVSQGKIVRDQLEKARANKGGQAFMKLAGTVRGPKNLSKRKGFFRP
jgi:hypothetical protein